MPAGPTRRIQSYTDLVAWQKAMDLVKQAYLVTRLLPREERFGLVAQIRRAAVSVPSNIAEGYGRRTRSDYVRFLDMARGSANELQTQLLIAVRLDMVQRPAIHPALALVEEVQKILRGLVSSLEASAKVEVRNPAGRRLADSRTSDLGPQT